MTWRDRGSCQLTWCCSSGCWANVADADVKRTVRSMPMLCADGGHGDLDPDPQAARPQSVYPGLVRRTGFTEHAFIAPDGYLFTVGVHELSARPKPLPPSGHLFRFVR